MKGKEDEKVRSLIILSIAVMGLCFCSALIAQEEGAQAPAATTDVITVEQGGAPAAEQGAAPEAAPAATTDVTTTKEEAPAAPKVEKPEKQ